MSSPYPPQDLDCPDPQGCTVASTRLEQLAGAGGLCQAVIPASRPWVRVYDAQDGYSTANPGVGTTRFAPFDAVGTGLRVPTLYLAEDLEAALLETSLHNVAELQPRVIDERTLLGKLHAEVVPPQDLHLVDLRDQQLQRLGLDRENVSSSSAEHYPCTRRVARAIHSGYDRAVGIIWHSRQAELTGRGPREVLVIFADRVDTSRDAWDLALRRTASGSLLEGAGRLLLDDLADSLQVDVETSDDLDD